MTYPEGRQPLGADDMAKMHPSTWEQECETLRRDYSLMQIDRNNLRSLLDATEAKVDELHDKLDDAQAEAKAFRAENERLRAALTRLSTAECFGDGAILGQHLPGNPFGREIVARMNFARAALQKQEGGQ